MGRVIGLITPYSGGNLGDGAIQEAVIQNLRARLPGLEIIAFTLDPEETERRHPVSAQPIAAMALPYYSVATPSRRGSSPGAEGATEETRPAWGTLRTVIKESRWLGPVARAAVYGIRGLVAVARMATGELTHTVRAFWALRRMDLLIVSGGGQVDDYWGGPWGHPYVLFKWALLARVTRTPFLFLSVGVCDLRSPMSRFFAGKALRWATYRSFRDAWSRDVAQVLAGTEADPVMPDLAFSFGADDCSSEEAPQGDPPVIAVSPIAHLSPRYWPKQDAGAYRRYVRELAAFVRSRARRGHRVILFTTASPDRHAVDDLMSEMPGDLSSSVEVANTRTVSALFALLARVDLVVASRLHGVLLAHLAGKPVLAISYDRKVSAHMLDLDQARFCLDIADFDSGGLDTAFEILARERVAVHRTLRARVSAYRGRLSRQYDDILQRCRERG